MLTLTFDRTQEKMPPATVVEQPKPQLVAPQNMVAFKRLYKIPPDEDPNDYVIALEGLKEMSAPVDCPRCHQRSMTKTDKVSGDTVT
jgi:hypothetical protein